MKYQKDEWGSRIEKYIQFVLYDVKYGNVKLFYYISPSFEL